MKVSSTLLKAVRVPKISPEVLPYQFPALSSISARDLPNNGFGVNNYYIGKSKFGHWPVYKKVQNTKTTTEIKRIQGDVNQFKRDLLACVPALEAKHVTVNLTAGYVNVKGDVVDQIKAVLEEKVVV